MPFLYDGEQWEICQTADDENGAFHAILGERRESDQKYTDKSKLSHRMNLTNFLLYYKTKPRPQSLKDALQDCFKALDRSVDNDDHFINYIKDIKDGRPISQDELVLVATLENINIVLFGESGADPRVIKPAKEILKGYPLSNQNQLSTAVISFDGNSWKRMEELGPESKGSTSEENRDITRYRRTPGYIAGVLYEINLLTIVLLNALEKHETWRLSSNNVAASYFDDVVLEWGPSNRAFLLQAKSRQRKIYPSDLFGNKYGGLSLCKYFFAYEALKKNFQVNHVVLCTNLAIPLDTYEEYYVERSLSDGDLLYLEGVEGKSFAFKEEFAQYFIGKLNSYECDVGQKQLICEENVKAFLKDLQLVCVPSSERHLERAIANKILAMGLAGQYESADFARQLNRQITKWYDKSSRYLTPLDAKAMFCGMKSDKIAEKLNKLKIEFKPDRLHLPAEKKVLHLIPDTDSVLSLLKVCRWLEVGGSRALYLSTTDSRKNQLLAAEGFESSKYSHLVVYVTKAVQEVEKMYDRIVRALNKHGEKRVIVIGDRTDKLAGRLESYYRSTFEAAEDVVLFTDFRERSQEELSQRAILFYEASL